MWADYINGYPDERKNSIKGIVQVFLNYATDQLFGSESNTVFGWCRRFYGSENVVLKKRSVENIQTLDLILIFFFLSKLLFWLLKYFLLLAPSTAVQCCLASVLVPLPASPNWKCADPHPL